VADAGVQGRDRVSLISRNGIAHTRRFPEIGAAVASLKPRTLVFDGEVAMFDQQPTPLT